MVLTIARHFFLVSVFEVVKWAQLEKESLLLVYRNNTRCQMVQNNFNMTKTPPGISKIHPAYQSARIIHSSYNGATRITNNHYQWTSIDIFSLRKAARSSAEIGQSKRHPAQECLYTSSAGSEIVLVGKQAAVQRPFGSFLPLLVLWWWRCLGHTHGPVI